MRTQSFKSLATAILIVTSLSLCACGSMTTREKNMAIGAGAGAAVGAIFTGGSAVGTAAGAAAGGAIGHAVTK